MDEYAKEYEKIRNIAKLRELQKQQRLEEQKKKRRIQQGPPGPPGPMGPVGPPGASDPALMQVLEKLTQVLERLNKRVCDLEARLLPKCECGNAAMENDYLCVDCRNGL